MAFGLLHGGKNKTAIDTWVRGLYIATTFHPEEMARDSAAQHCVSPSSKINMNPT